jgi:hypothetical protein
MSHKLEPKDGASFLPPQAAIERLRAEFDYVGADRDAGADHVGQMVAAFLRLNAPEATVQFYAARQGDSFQVEVADDSDSEIFIRFALIPDVAPLIGYSSAQDEAASRPLVERCARALNYRIVLV